MTSRELLQIVMVLASEEHLARLLEHDDDVSVFPMFLIDGQWYEAEQDGNRMVFVSQSGGHHPSNFEIAAIKITDRGDLRRWNPPVTHSVDVKHNLKLRGS